MSDGPRHYFPCKPFNRASISSPDGESTSILHESINQESKGGPPRSLSSQTAGHRSKTDWHIFGHPEPKRSDLLTQFAICINHLQQPGDCQCEVYEVDLPEFQTVMDRWNATSPIAIVEVHGVQRTSWGQVLHRISANRLRSFIGNVN